MFSMGFSVEEKLIDLRKLPKDLQPALQELAETMLKDAEITIPEKTGALKDSGWARADGQKDVELGYNEPYAQVHEFGRADGKKFTYVKKNARTGWLQKTLAENREKYLRDIGNASQRQLREQSFKNRVLKRVSRWFR